MNKRCKPGITICNNIYILQRRVTDIFPNTILNKCNEIYSSNKLNYFIDVSVHLFHNTMR